MPILNLEKKFRKIVTTRDGSAVNNRPTSSVHPFFLQYKELNSKTERA